MQDIQQKPWYVVFGIRVAILLCYTAVGAIVVKLTNLETKKLS